MVKTLRFHCRGCAFDPWSGKGDPAHHVVWQKKIFFLILKVVAILMGVR